MNSTNCIDSSNSIVCVVGLGYVGLPLAQAFSKSFNVIGFDTDTQKVKQLISQQSELPIQDPLLVTA